MKLIFSIWATVFASAAFATVNPEQVLSCVHRLSDSGHDYKVCAGVKNATEVAAVVSCVNKLNGQGDDYGVCTGVKNSVDVSAVVSCVKKLNGQGLDYGVCTAAY